MNEPERTELERLKQRHTRLEQELKLLGKQLGVLDLKLRQSPPSVVAGSSQSAIACAAPADLLKTPTEPKPAQPSPVPATTPIPPVISPVPVAARAIEPVIQPSPKSVEQVAKGSIPQPLPIPQSITPVLPTDRFSQKAADVKGPAAEKERSFEMRLGTYWFVRIGTVLVLTALVFFGNLAYQNYISKLGPGGKLALLYVASFLLLGAGAWWQRKVVKESLHNYARVLFAGGLAAVYFTTYAAHHIEPLRVIENPALDGALLLGWAGFMVWIADRKKSEVLALFAVGLGYYTSIITRVGLFTLYSNLVLTLAAVVFLVRNRWAMLTLGSLVASYVGYTFWRFFDGSEWHWASPGEGLWTGTYFLASYWIVFTAAVFMSRHKQFTAQNRAGFLTLNNGAFFGLFVLTMLQVQQGGFWKFSLIYGSVLLVLAVASVRMLADEPLARNAYLTQGLLLVTIGFISKFSGLQLALILAMESIVLLITGQQRSNKILVAGAYLAAGLSVGWGIDGMKQFDTPGLWLAIGLGALMLVNTLLTHRQTISAAEPFRPQVGYFTVLALITCLVATWDNASEQHFPIVVAGEGLLLTLSFYALRVRELTLLSQSYLLVAQGTWLFNRLSGTEMAPWWNPVILLAITLALAHWWQKQQSLKLPPGIAGWWQGAFSLAVVLLIYFWLREEVSAPSWLVLTSFLAIGLTAYGVLMRAWWLAAFGQFFMAVSGLQFVWQLAQDKPFWPLALAPIFALGFLSFATVEWFRRSPTADARISNPLLQTALVYRCLALVMSIWWVCDYVAEREKIWVLSLLGIGVFLWAGWKRNREALYYSAAYTLVALALFWPPLLDTSTVYLPNLVAILILLAQRQVAARFPDRYPLQRPIHTAVMVVGGLSVWLFLSRWVLENASGFYLTASWSALALAFFTAGIVLRERVYRWLGLGVLGLALGRVVVFDVWKLETLYRILSFMALGVVLLVLGFIYNKYQEKIRQWL